MTPIAPALDQGADAGRPDDADMNRQPFDAVPNGGIYFEEPIREKRLNLLVHLAPYSEVLLITGEEGGGKTCLLDRFVARAAEGWRVCRLAATPDTGPEQVLATLDEALSLKAAPPEEDRETFIRRMREGLHALRHSALVPVLAIDDAHHLSIPVLQLLAALTEPMDGDQKLLSVVLFGESGINDTLAMPELEGLRARVSHSFDLPPMSEEQTGEYIRHCLSAAGMEADGPFTPSVTRFIHVASRGLPGRVNELAREVLQHSRRPARQPESAGTRRRAGGLWRYVLGGAGVAVLALGVLYQDRLTAPVGDDGAAAGEAGGATVPAPPFEARESARGVEDDGAAAPLPPGPGRRASGADTGGGERSDTTTQARAGQAAAVPAEGLSGDGDAGARVESPAVTGSERPSVADSPDPARDARAGSAAPAEDGDSVPAGQAGKQEEAPPATAPTTTPEGLKGEDWLRSQDAGAYTVQLLAMSEPRVIEYIERHGLADEVAVYRVGAGRELLAVTYGLFESRDGAARAGARLTERLGGGLSPLVRSVGAIQVRLAGGPSAPGKAQAGTGAAKGEEWLLAQDARRYTLQLMAVSDDKARAFVERQELGDEAALYRTRSGGRELTAVTYGLYESRAAAREAAGTVAQRLGLSPWPRSLSEIHAAIAALQAER